MVFPFSFECGNNACALFHCLDLMELDHDEGESRETLIERIEGDCMGIGSVCG